LFNIDGHLTTTTKKVDLNLFDSGNQKLGGVFTDEKIVDDY
jgi:hypothetical protein